MRILRNKTTSFNMIIRGLMMEISFEEFANGRKFSESVKKHVESGAIPLMHAELLLNCIPAAEQDLFLFEAMNFTFRSFKSVLGKWKKLRPEKQEILVQILDDVKDAFDNWQAWSGNQTGNDVEEYEQMVATARGRVLAYLHGLAPPPADKII